MSTMKWVFDESLIEVTKHVTLPTFQIPEEAGKPVFWRIESKIERSKDIAEEFGRRRRVKDPVTGELKDAPKQERSMEPPDVMQVCDLKTGEVGQCIVNETLRTNLLSRYSEDSYVGQCFKITFLGKKKSASGFTYKQFEILEIRLKEPAPKTPQATAPPVTKK